jgi:DNA repair protein RadC
MGEAKAASLAAAFELGRRAAIGGEPTTRVTGPEDLVRAVLPCIGDVRREEAFVLVLDGSNRLLRVERLTSGSADQTLLPAREVVGVALRCDGSAFGVAHTHPSGNTEPSSADVTMTAELVEAARTTGLRFVDHVIVAQKRWMSLRELGYIT